jgi:transposase
MTRRQYTDEYKHHAVQLSHEPKKTVAGVARDLGIPENNLWRWREEYAVANSTVVRKAAAATPEQQRIKELEGALAKVSEERDILKKTIAIFSRSK